MFRVLLINRTNTIRRGTFNMNNQNTNGILNNYSSSAHSLPQVFLASAGRSPVGSMSGSLKSLSAIDLGSQVVRATIERAGLKPSDVEEVYMGSVLQANLGQSPARQVAIKAGCPDSTEATTINKVCASGMKSIILATQNLQTGNRSVMVAGGMESMSNSPFYLPRGASYGHFQATDSIVKDGLWDAYNSIHMGSCAEETAVKHSIGREAQDDYAIESYSRAKKAWEAGVFKDEIVPIEIADKRTGKVTLVNEDEEYKNIKLEKVRSLRPVFKKENGTVTAANASTLNDGASAVVLMTGEKADALGIKKLAKIISYADAACAPVDFPIAPTLAIPIALERAGLKIEDMSKIEINEAFSVVALANLKILGINSEKVNVYGGAVALGHPIGSSGCRIVVTLAHALKSGEYGLAGVCNGGGAASAIVIQKL
ncbi:acetyl-CoA acetyltransferase [Phakopsora pachyrhizi]|uniref:acetyl-CoA C-acetyltransferase n=1 Tax=Phakopsora pachyrhizi TaxID=170000 RepID=A0AAV0BQW8_PHAPC|nr:acetyl-CoA acetyltransferase [Phakopsora pachyrhizi]CAH7689075.1 acetyl-CoA acetyltransferase [Phakopsora pachyrhizi]